MSNRSVSQRKSIPLPSSQLPTKSQTKKFISKIPVRSKASSLSPSRSPRPVLHTSQSAPSKIPVTAASKKRIGAFQFVAPATVNSKDKLVSRESSNEDSDTDQLKDEELKQKLREEKRHGRKTGELLTQLHENYKDLLEKYAQAENTIDQLRFKPNFISENNTPRSNLSEAVVHFIPPVTISIPTSFQSNEIHHSTTVTPLSSFRQMTSTRTTPLMKSLSPPVLCEDQPFDEQSPSKQDELRSSNSDLLNQSRTFGDKMKSFLTLMDANQLSLAEQKQVYESIRQDYQRLLDAFDQNRSIHQDDDHRQTDLNNELASMKQLLQDIVKSITQNLLDKSMNSSRHERSTRFAHNESRSSEGSLRSSLYNQDELLSQYQKVLTAVNGQRNDYRKIESPVVSPTTKPENLYAYPDTSPQKSEGDHQETHSHSSSPPSIVQNTRTLSNQNPVFTSENERKSITEKPLTMTRRPSRTSETYQNYPPSMESQRTHGNDYDSGIGTTKISRERLYTSTIDETRSHSFLDGRESNSSRSSSRTSVIGLESPTRFHDQPPPSKQYYQQLNRRNVSIKTRPEMNFYEKKSRNNDSDSHLHRSHHTWRPKQANVNHRTTASIVPRTRSNSRYPPTQIYRSTLFINPVRSQVQTEDRTRYVYVEPRTSVVYRSVRNVPRSISSQGQNRCTYCGAVSVVHRQAERRRSSRVPAMHRVRQDLDDPGYESEHRTNHYESESSSSDSDSDIDEDYSRQIVLNEAHIRAARIEQYSKMLSRSIRRRLRLTFAARNSPFAFSG